MTTQEATERVKVMCDWQVRGWDKLGKLVYCVYRFGYGNAMETAYQLLDQGVAHSVDIVDYDGKVCDRLRWDIVRDE